jgi:nucleotide-binding universal stress UspA family protein
MFKKILVPLDGSRLSSKALPYADELARKFNGEVTLLRVVKPTTPVIITDPSGIGGSMGAQVSIEAARITDKQNTTNAERYLHTQVKRLKDKGIKATSLVIVGGYAESIIKCYHKNRMSIVVMTTHGRSGFKRAILGSVADKVIHEPGLSVLVVHPKN